MLLLLDQPINILRESTNTSMATSGEGFDLDAIPDSSQNPDHDVIYELGGGASVVERHVDRAHVESTKAGETETKEVSSSAAENDPTFESEEMKRKGNEFFKKGDYLNAYDLYTDAIEACPGMTGEEIMKLKEEHELQEREKANQRYLRDTDRRRRPSNQNAQNSEEDGADKPEKEESENNEDDQDSLEPSEFELPPHEFATKLAVYYSNRAACLLHECKYNDAIKDCDIAILVNPKYTKAHIRRMTAYEKTEQTEEALRDAKEAATLDPNNKEIQKHVKRLQKLEDERLEKLKEETMGKLKDLGNSILGNFGLSLDNFKAQQDPNTGSYNISFQN